MDNKILELIKYGDAALKEAGIEKGKLEAEMLLCHVVNKTRIQLYIDLSGFIAQEKIDQYKSLIKERMRRKPLQYILGTAAFYGLEFMVNESVLIPRPETETLVELALEHINNRFERMLSVLDIGTGSGNIAVSIAKNSNIVEVFAMDNNEKSLEVAKHNAEENGVKGKIQFMNRSIYDDYEELKTTIDGYIDVIVSNPPYIADDQVEKLMPEISQYEPHYALAAGADGLEFIKKIILVANGLLKYNGVLIVEIGDDQKRDVEAFASRYFSIEFANDLNGVPRFLIAEKRG